MGEGKKLGIEEGKRLVLDDEEYREHLMSLGHKETYMLMKETFQRNLENTKMVLIEEGKCKGKKEGFEEGRAIGKAEAEKLKDEQTLLHVNLSSQMVTIETVKTATQMTSSLPYTESSTQTTSITTTNAVTQMATHDKTPANRSTPIMSPLMMPAQPPSTATMLSTTTTTRAPPTSKRPPAAQNRRHTLPS